VRRRWEIYVGTELVQQLTLYGEPCDDTRAALLTMISEAIAISGVEHSGEIRVRCVMI
jgi:hypothetical protein